MNVLLQNVRPVYVLYLADLIIGSLLCSHVNGLFCVAAADKYRARSCLHVVESVTHWVLFTVIN